MQSIRTIETTGFIENQNLVLDEQLPFRGVSKVRVLIFLPETGMSTKSSDEKSTRKEKLLEIAHHCASLPRLNNRSSEEIIDYDEYGLPR
jgi:hypothetical protein